jgi:hypothetical protein
VVAFLAMAVVILAKSCEYWRELRQQKGDTSGWQGLVHLTRKTPKNPTLARQNLA